MKVKVENSGRPKLKKNGQPYKDGRLVYDYVDIIDGSCLTKKCFRIGAIFQVGSGSMSHGGLVCILRHLNECPKRGTK